MSAEALQRSLGISQPTLSRALAALGSERISFRLSGDRTPRHALARAVVAGPEVSHPTYRVLRDGSVVPGDTYSFLRGGATLVERKGGGRGKATTLCDGLPPAMQFAAPSGFLGRQVALEAGRLIDAPATLRDWSDDHKARYLLTLAADTPGNLVFGDAPLRLALDQRAQAQVVACEAKPAHHLAVSRQLASALPGSSAGGEQPKFLCETEDHGHVIVKFARRGSRMATLLALEHLALRTLRQHGHAAADTALLAFDDTTFLEVVRFDRIGRFGRRGMLSAGAYDDEFFGQRTHWSAFAQRCVAERVLQAKQADAIHLMAAYSELIANTDTHFENISLLLDDDGQPEGVAPAYDLLPMKYAPLGGGIDPPLTPIAPSMTRTGTPLDAWVPAYRAARDFWRAVEAGDVPAPVPDDFKKLAHDNLAAIDGFMRGVFPALGV